MVDLHKGGSAEDDNGAPRPPQPPAPETQVPPYGQAPPPYGQPAPPYGQAPPPYGQPEPSPYPPYGAPGAPGAPYGPVPASLKIPGQVDPETGLVYSDKERLTAGLLQLIISFLGFPGIGRLYTGHTAVGLAQLIGAIVGWLLTCILVGLPLAIGMWLWGIIDGIVMLTSRTFTDAQGRVLR
ncbi:TM2 domain-containing protein [Nocardioides sp. TF02-7]|uniref:TM2 domain-containing protein n=1 Tax=Nocardioides sp. TF02-7 TaxID=2917724 RepID=UPI001F05C87A|nr:TM2 domain-containing protein [Nocardioides sp. TF02-7]UMG92920.1 TM2 domain-containing protein [Nocardioides sp. TF02-7]